MDNCDIRIKSQHSNVFPRGFDAEIQCKKNYVTNNKSFIQNYIIQVPKKV